MIALNNMCLALAAPCPFPPKHNTPRARHERFETTVYRVGFSAPLRLDGNWFLQAKKNGLAFLRTLAAVKLLLDSNVWRFIPTHVTICETELRYFALHAKPRFKLATF